ncbi:threonine aldolase family protein, partial [Ellagibacter isourolithinifaciens]
MIRLNCDYCKGALPEVLEALQTINDQAFCGYGCDEVCERAARLIRERAGAPSADVHFLVGGTQANFIVIESALRPWQSVICADSGHINVHETGAVEHAGHKCETAPAHDGKISADQVRAIAANWAGSIIPEHITQPKMVYLSMATETGSVYTLAELAAIRAVCDEFSLYLFIDGARLSYGLEAIGGDVSLEDIARLADVFYCGGT